MHEGARNRKLDRLIGADRPPEDDPLARVGHGPVDEPAGVADAFRGDQDPLGVEAVEDVPEAVALFANERIIGQMQVGDEQGIGLVVDHGLDGPNLDRRAGLAQVDQEQAHTLGLAWDVLGAGGAGQQQEQIGVLDA